MAEGDGSSRNFRSAYYEKLGFCGNEDKNFLDLLIASSPFDLEKLNDLCERFEPDRRCVEAWKILLGVESGRKNPFDDFANVKRVRAEHFQSLKHNLEVLLRHNIVIKDRLKQCSKQVSKPLDNHKHSHENLNLPPQYEFGDSNVSMDGENQVLDCNYETPIENRSSSYNVENDSKFLNGKKEPSKLNLIEDIQTNSGKQITLMHLLEDGKLESSDIDAQLNSTYCLKLLAMANFFVNVTCDLQEAFFLFRSFTKNKATMLSSTKELMALLQNICKTFGIVSKATNIPMQIPKSLSSPPDHS